MDATAPADVDELAKLERRVLLRRELVQQGERERRRLKWFIVLAVTTWPLGMLHSWWVVAWIFFGWLTFWAVGVYTNYFHRRRMRESLADAEAALQRARETTT